MTTTLRHYPLGARMPDTPHAVCSSLPTLADVRGYEEKEPRVVEALTCGYPRFLEHPYLRRLAALWLDRAGLGDRKGVLVRGEEAARGLRAFLRGECEPGELSGPEDIRLMHVPNEERTARRALRFVQHTGCAVSSRQAEDWLAAEGAIEGVFEEPVFEGDAEGEIRRRMAALHKCSTGSVGLFASGMNAFHAAFQAVREWARPRKRGVWVQLGWLYLDTTKIMESMLDHDERLERVVDARDGDAVQAALRRAGANLAAVVVEAPTNPLIQVPDLERVAAEARRLGAVVIADPTIASAYNVHVMPYADLVVTSLTKYAARFGDVMAGTLAVDPDSPHAAELDERVRQRGVPLARRDAARLALEMQGAEDFCARVNASTEALAEFFEAHPRVRAVHWAGDAASREAFRKIARSPDAWGAMLTLDLEIPLERFYDRVACGKGPSFGTGFTLIAPFLYLAHYDLVSTEEGRRYLAEAGLNPELARISVGAEPIDALKAMFAEALDGA